MLTVKCQSIMRSSSRSKTLNSPRGIPPTRAYTLLLEKASQRHLLETAMAAITKRWQVRDVRKKMGIRAET